MDDLDLIGIDYLWEVRFPGTTGKVHAWGGRGASTNNNVTISFACSLVYGCV